MLYFKQNTALKNADAFQSEQKTFTLNLNQYSLQ